MNTKLEDELVWLSVEKDSLRATLYTLPAYPKEPVPLQSFRIAIGKEKGDKVRQGDRKTPEGIYFAKPHVPERNLYVPKYGRLAVPLDFPNPLDHMLGKSGHGIWLHGAGDDNRIAAENVTEGCVAFYNNDIVKLKNWLIPDQGIVLISSDGKNVNSKQDLKDVSDRTRKWFENWQNRDLETYIDFYSEGFDYVGKNKAAYKNYKSRIFRSYKVMTLKTTTLRVLVHPKYAVAVMNQKFQGDRHYKSEGRKVLYWQKEDNQWKIVRETFSTESLSKRDLSEDSLQSLRPMLTQKQ
jgi:murein L,D-transpeptidase YafK